MMRPVRSLLFVLFAALLASAPAAQAAGSAKPRVAVLEFVDKSTHYYSWYHVGRAAQDMMVTALVKGDAFRVIDRERLQALMQEKNLSLSGDVDPKTAVKVGKLLGVEYLIVGAITEFGVTNSGASVPGYGGLPSFSMRTQRMDAAVDARAINTSTGEIVVGRHGERLVLGQERLRRGRGRRVARRPEAGQDPAPCRRQARHLRLGQEARDDAGWAGRRTRRASSARSRRPTAARST